MRLRDVRLTMTAEEATGMRGTLFNYIIRTVSPLDGQPIEDDIVIPAYVKAFDPKIGLTCMSVDSLQGTEWEGQLEEDGSLCVIAVDYKASVHTPMDAYKRLQIIRDTGEYVAVATYGEVGNEVQCAFGG